MDGDSDGEFNEDITEDINEDIDKDVDKDANKDPNEDSNEDDSDVDQDTSRYFSKLRPPIPHDFCPPPKPARIYRFTTMNLHNPTEKFELEILREQGEKSTICCIILEQARMSVQTDDQLKRALQVQTPQTVSEAKERLSANDSEARPGGAYNGLIESSALLRDIDAMFDDMTTNVWELGFGGAQAPFVRDNTRIRIVTMCSGTDSPLIALNLVQRSLQRQGKDYFKVNHLASCEIEPFKQAFIERNFSPPTIFHDVTEFTAHKREPDNPEMLPSNAYGATAEIPKDVHILIAGSSCVDHSKLNSKPDKEHGESAMTLLGVADYADKYRPVIILLENVTNVEWSKQTKFWARRGYFLRTLKVDSKNFYLPQTRERAYSLAVDMQHLATLYGADKVEAACEKLCEHWQTCMDRLQRRASLPYTEFMLETDDPRLQIAKAMTEDRKVNKLNIDWKSCQKRHTRERAEKLIGTKRPFTNRETDGRSRLSDHAWQKWSFGSSTREQDMLDIAMLRSVSTRDIDITSKSRVLDISQNVDRETDNRAWGVVGCITPSGNIFETRRGGPLVGLETLALQGMPIDNLDLTKATLRQLQNLAGNAMTTTVIGASILSTLIACHKLATGRKYSPHWRSRDTPPSKTSLFQNYIDRHLHDPVEKTGLLDYQKVRFDSSSVLEESEGLESLNVIRSAATTWQAIVKEAEASQRLCLCENLGEHTTADVKHCRTCFYTVCDGGECSRTPHDDFEILKVDHVSRGSTDAFIARLLRHLPGVLKFSLGKKVQGPHSAAAPVFDPTPELRQVLGSEFRFKGVKYGATWKVVFESPNGRLELEFAQELRTTSKAHDSNSLLPHAFKVRPVWLLFARCDPRVAAGGKQSDELKHPVARMYPKGSCFSGDWEVWKGYRDSLSLKIHSSNTYKDAWEAKLGLQGEFYPNLRIYDELTVSFEGCGIASADPDVEALRDVRGHYKLVEKCPAPYGRLYVRQNRGTTRHDPVFFYLNSGQMTNAVDDRMEFGTRPPTPTSTDDRNLLLRLKDTFLPTVQESDATAGTKMLKGVLFNRWGKGHNLSLQPAAVPAKYFVQPDSLFITRSGDCKDSLSTIFLAKWTPSENFSQYPEGKFTTVLLENKPGALKDFSWMTTAAAMVPQLNQGWLAFSDQALARRCSEPDLEPGEQMDPEQNSAEELEVMCAPKRPQLRWVEFQLNNSDGTTKPQQKLMEDAKAAHDYEKALKMRPVIASATIHCKAGELCLQIQINVIALMHRAVAELDSGEDDIYASWRLCHHPPFAARPSFPRLRLLSNADMPLAPSNPQLSKQLWSSQRKTLTWMIDRESSEPRWVEEILKETCIPALGWRLEVKASRNLAVLGGILADKVGAGKTTTSLELVRRDFVNPFFHHERIDSHLHTETTLIVVPKNLMKQWAEAIAEVMGRSFGSSSKSGKLIVVREPKELMKLSVGDILKARILLVSLNLFEGQAYWEAHRMVACAPNVPEKAGRAFDEYLHDSLGNLSAFMEASDDWRNLKGFWRQWNHAKGNIGSYNRFSGVKTRKSKKAEYKAAGASASANPPAPGTRKRPASASQTAGVSSPNKKAKGPGAVSKSAVKTSKTDTTDKTDTTVWVDVSSQAFEKGEKADFEEMAKDFLTKKAVTPVLHMFNFRRLIVDEFTYAKPLTLSALLKIKSSSRWMLSGTPPIHDYDSVNTMAKLLGTKLSTFDEKHGIHGFIHAPSATDRLKSLSEEFEEYQGIGSPAFMRYIYGRAQDFSDTFIRQDDCSEPKTTKKHELLPFKGSIPELVDYAEVDHIMTSNDCRFNVTRTNARIQGKTSEQIRQVLRESHTGPLAALVCSMTDLASSRMLANQSTQITSEDVLNGLKTKIIRLCRDLLDELKVLFYCLRNTHTPRGHRPFHVFLNNFYRLAMHSLDPSIVPILDRLISYASEHHPNKLDDLRLSIPAKWAGTALKEAKEPAIQKRIDKATDKFGKMVPHYQSREVDERTTMAEILVGDIVDASRRLQFIIVAKAVNEGQPLEKCSSCGNTPDASRGLAAVKVSGVCGHIVGCADCTAPLPMASARCPNEFCSAQVGHLWAGDFFAKNADAQQSSQITVTRMLKAVDVINNIPDDEFVLVFVQFRDMAKQFTAACAKDGIGCVDATTWPTAAAARTSSGAHAQKIEKFKRTAEEKKDGATKVLLLRIDSEDAAGWNLQCANHVVFLAPFVGDSAVHAWDTMVQAVGRAHRPGQKKVVHVYHIYGAETVEQEMAETAVEKFRKTA